jgi:hypothetical protein
MNFDLLIKDVRTNASALSKSISDDKSALQTRYDNYNNTNVKTMKALVVPTFPTSTSFTISSTLYKPFTDKADSL